MPIDARVVREKKMKKMDNDHAVAFIAKPETILGGARMPANDERRLECIALGGPMTDQAELIRAPSASAGSSRTDLSLIHISEPTRPY